MDNHIFFKCVLIAAVYLGFVSNDGDKPKQISLVISYETESIPSNHFFNEQLTYALFDSINKCGVIRWNFMPCPTSSMVGGELSCRDGPEQCKWDKIHACAATIYAQHQDQVGKFIICFFTKDRNQDAVKCAGDNGMDYNTIQACVNEKKGDRYCNAFFDNIINDVETRYNPGVKFGSKYDANLNLKAVTNFKSVLCEELKSNDLKCDEVCSC